MAANLKIGIIADDNGAQQKFEGLSTSVDLTAKSVDQLRNMMAKLTVENVKLTSDLNDMAKGSKEWTEATRELEHIQDVLARVTRQYDNAVQRLGLSYQTGTDSLKNYRQELKMLQSQYQKAMAQGQGTDFSATDMQGFELLTSKIDEVTEKIKELEKEERERAEVVAKNNSLMQFQNSIEQANIQGILQKEKALKDLTATIAKANLQQEQYNKNALANFQSSVTQADIQNILTKEKALKEFTLTLQKANLQQEQYNRNAFSNVQDALEKASIQNILIKEKALKDFTNTLAKANLQQSQYNAQAVNSFSTGAMSTASGQTLEYQAQGLLGNTVNQLRADYQAYYQQLLKVIAVYGVESSEAQNLAQKLGALDKQIKDLSTQTTATTKRIGNLIKNFVSAQMIVWAIRKAFTSLVSTLKESAEAAAEAEETYNLFITTFEDVASTAEKTATRLASSLGMANSTAQQALGTFGDLAAGYGATDKEALEFGETATQVAMDIISYKNISGDTATTLQSIASGLAGNVENFRKLGYVMTQAEVKTKLQKKGLDKLTGASLQYAQIQARLEILQEKSVKAQGDMVKTLDSTTNVTRRLSEAWQEYKENLGESVNSLFYPIKKWWLEILTATNKAIKAKEEFLATGSNAGVFDASTNEEDYKAFINALQSGGRSLASGGGSEGSILGISSKKEDEFATAMANLKTIVGTYGATAEQVQFYLKDVVGYKEETVEKIYTELKAWKEENEKEVETKSDFEDTKSNMKSRLSTAISLLDSLTDLNEGRTVDISAMNTISDKLDEAVFTSLLGKKSKEKVEALKANRLDSFGSDIEETTQSLVNEILDSFANADIRNFADTLDILLGDATIEDALETKLEKAKSIYETLWNDLLTGGETTAEQLERALENVKEVQKEIDKETLKDNASSSLLGEWATLASNPLQWLIDLLAQTEAVQKFGTLLSDSILPAVNACLEPLLPMLDAIGDLIQNTVLPVLYALFPVIKAIAATITLLTGLLDTFFSFISNSVKWIVGNIVSWVQDGINWCIDLLNKLPWVNIGHVDWGFDSWADIDVIGEANKTWKETLDAVEDIKNCTMKIKENTDEDEMDLTVLNNLFDSGIISRDEMNSLRASYLGQADPGKQTQLMASQAGDYASYLRAGGTTSVNYGDVSIEINSDSGDPEKIAKEVARVLEEWQRNGKKSFAVAIA